MSAILYSMIYKAAEANGPEMQLGDSVSKWHREVWAPHWIDTARFLAKRYEAEGLEKTAAALRSIADEQEKFL